MTFLNDSRQIGWMPQWDRVDLPKLWQYNLHYFEWLWALRYEDARAAALDWIERHPLARGNVGWEPYPVSLRLLNWCGVFFGLFRQQIEADIEFGERLWESVYHQAQWLAGHLEFHLGGNHLLENAAALAFVGNCFVGEAAKTWYGKGCGLLRTEIAEQILPDGLHYERSPMYHLRMTYLLALLESADDGDLKALVEEPLERMRKALCKVCHPDGQIALLNDSAFGIYHFLGSEQRQPDGKAGIVQNGFGAWSLPDAGYYGWRGAEGNYLICDAGAIGPDHIPGHAHADIFSFELSLRGCRVIVDSGVHDYERSAMRSYCRSTRGHNTVEINGLDQCEMWAAFRVARRGGPRDVKWVPREDGFDLEGWHDGYRRLPGSPRHTRRFKWRADGDLIIHDCVSGSKPADIVSRIHLHPSCRVRSLGKGIAMVEFPRGTFHVSAPNQAPPACHESHYCSRFGVTQPNQVLEFASRGKQMESEIRIELLPSGKSIDVL